MKKGVFFIYFYLGLAALSLIYHNLIFAFGNKKESLFFILTIVSLVVFVLLLVYNTLFFVYKGQPADLWKLGFLGLIGLLGFWGDLGLFGFFGFFGFFGTRRRKHFWRK